MTQDRHRGIVLVLSFAAVLAIQLYFGRFATEPYMLPDEFGYMATAAYLVGLDWSRLVAVNPFYHPGYAITLVPLFSLFDDASQIYRWSVFINCLFGACVFPLAYKTCRRLAEGSAWNESVLVALVASLYPSVLVYSKMAIAESLFVFLYWWGIERFSRGFGPPRGLSQPYVTGALTAAPFLVHPRGLGIFAAGLLTIGTLRWRRAVNTPQLLRFVAGAAAVFSVTLALNEHLLVNLWLRDVGPERLTTNTLAAATDGRLWQALSTGDGVSRLFLTAGGQFLYLCAATFGFFLVGLISIPAKLVGPWTGKERAGGFGRQAVHLYALGAFLAVFATSVLFCFRSGRGDAFLYGRYNEGVLGPIFVFGLAWTRENARSGLRRYILSSVLLIGLGLILHVALRDLLASMKMHLTHVTALFSLRTHDWKLEVSTIVLYLIPALSILTVLLKLFPRAFRSACRSTPGFGFLFGL